MLLMATLALAIGLLSIKPLAGPLLADGYKLQDSTTKTLERFFYFILVYDLCKRAFWIT